LMHQRRRSAHPCLIAAPGMRPEPSSSDRRSLPFACPAPGPIEALNTASNQRQQDRPTGLHAAGFDARRRFRESGRRSVGPGSPCRRELSARQSNASELACACLILVSAWTGQHLQARPPHELSRRRAMKACSGEPNRRIPALDIPTRDLATTRIGLASRSPRTIPLTLPICSGWWGAEAHLHRQGLPGLPWCAGVPVRRACRTGTVPLAVELIEGHGAGGEREPSRDARMPPGSRTGLRDGRAAGRVPADPWRSGAGRRTPARNHRVGRGSGRRPDARERRGGAGRCGPGSPGLQEGAAARCVAPVVPSR
jgi:hypothetical protein